MNNRHWQRILNLGTGLAVICALGVVLSYSIPTSEAKPACDVLPLHPSCKDDGGGSTPRTTYTVVVYFHVGTDFVEAGSAVNVPGSESGNRAGIGEVLMTINLDLLDTVNYLPGCDVSFGAPDAKFAIATAKIPKSSLDYTYVSAAWNNVKAEGLTFSVRPSLDGNGTIADQSNWLPTSGSNTVEGDNIDISVTKGPEKDGPCNGLIMQRWKAEVTPE